MLGAVLNHLLRQFVVHVLPDSGGGLFLLPCDLPDNLGLYWSCWRKGLNNRLGLELDDRFGQDWVVNTAGPFPWFGPFLHFQA